jgi:hypothetical protein
MYYGPELISEELARWARRHGVERLFIQPGRQSTAVQKC